MHWCLLLACNKDYIWTNDQKKELWNSQYNILPLPYYRLMMVFSYHYFGNMWELTPEIVAKVDITPKETLMKLATVCKVWIPDWKSTEMIPFPTRENTGRHVLSLESAVLDFLLWFSQESLDKLLCALRKLFSDRRHSGFGHISELQWNRADPNVSRLIFLEFVQSAPYPLRWWLVVLSLAAAYRNYYIICFQTSKTTCKSSEFVCLILSVN